MGEGAGDELSNDFTEIAALGRAQERSHQMKSLRLLFFLGEGAGQEPSNDFTQIAVFL